MRKFSIVPVQTFTAGCTMSEQRKCEEEGAEERNRCVLAMLFPSFLHCLGQVVVME